MELVITVVIASILMALALPSYNAYLANSKLRTAAQSTLAGLQMARSEAIRRNASTVFLLTTDAAPAASSTAAALGQSWVVRTTDASPVLIEAKAAAEGSGRTININDINNDGTANVGSIDSVTFTGMGTTTLAASATFTFTSLKGGACAPAGPMRCLNIVVSPGGQARLCDAAVTAGSNDTRACPA